MAVVLLLTVLLLLLVSMVRSRVAVKVAVDIAAGIAEVLPHGGLNIAAHLFPFYCPSIAFLLPFCCSRAQPPLNVS
jgi:hypothetical protein